jgi:hypothetical protein
MTVRLLVTGVDEDGKSVFTSDNEVPAATVALVPGAEFHRLWGADDSPKLPLDGSPTSQPAFFPPPGGYRFLYFNVPPAASVPEDTDIAAALAEFEEKLPGMAEHMEPDDPGMHTTRTIDFGVVLEGSVELELDHGARRTLNTGDGYIQNGTRHRWSNPGTEDARLAVVIIGLESS